MLGVLGLVDHGTNTSTNTSANGGANGGANGTGDNQTCSRAGGGALLHIVPAGGKRDKRHEDGRGGKGGAVHEAVAPLIDVDVIYPTPSSPLCSPAVNRRMAGARRGCANASHRP
jgi:hypothetical protein